MNIQEIRKMSNFIRLQSLEEIYAAQSGHIGGALSIADILAVLYGNHMRVDPNWPDWPDRDRFVLSKGHACAAYYAALAYCGFFDPEQLKTFRGIDSFLQGHPSMRKTPGVDISSGSLGQGLSCANGMALAGRIDGRDYRVYCLCGDGEMQEGQMWEAMMSSAHYGLDNLTLLVDVNGLQIDGETEAVMNVEPVADKIRSFGWRVTEIDGHDLGQIDEAVTQAGRRQGKPAAVVCRTVKGKGVSFMENQALWHGTAPDKTQYMAAREELLGRMEAER